MIKQKWYLLLIFYTFLTYQLFIVSGLSGEYRILGKLTAEDGFFETIDFVGLFTVGVLFVTAFLRSGRLEHRLTHTLVKRLAYLGLALLFFFGAFEEISWGQRVFGVETPEIMRQVNVQGEINIHNLRLFGIHLGPSTRRGFHIFWFTMMVLVPLVSAIYDPARRWLDRLTPIFPWQFGIPFLLNYLLLRGIPIVTAYAYRGYHFTLEEIYESNAAVCFVVAALYLVFGMLNPRSSEYQGET